MRRLLAAMAAVLALAGCGAQPEDTPSPVYTDWSHLTPYEPEGPAAALYTRFEPCSAGGPLLPRDDYGPLLPYVGKIVDMDHYIADTLPLFGLATADGRVVTDPVYADVSLGDFLLLYRGSDALYAREDPIRERGDFALTVAAPDGRWVRDAGDRYYVSSSGGEEPLLVLGGADGSLTVWNRDGEIAAEFPGALFRAYFDAPYQWGQEGGPWLELRGGVGYVTSYFYKGQSGSGDDFLRLYLDLRAGTVLQKPPAGCPAELEYEAPDGEEPSFPGYRHLSPMEDPVTGETYYFGYPDEGGCDLLDQRGRVLMSGYGNWYTGFPQVIGGKAAVWEGRDGGTDRQAFCWYDLRSGACTFRYPIFTGGDD